MSGASKRVNGGANDPVLYASISYHLNPLCTALSSMVKTMRPTLFSPHLLYGRGYDSQVGVCAWLNASDVTSVFWSSPDQRLNLYVRLTESPSDAINRLWKVVDRKGEKFKYTSHMIQCLKGMNMEVRFFRFQSCLVQWSKLQSF